MAGDSAAGYPANASYQRFLATCALSRIPPAWLAQTAPRARIVAPIAQGPIALDVCEPGHAQGHFPAEVGYLMPPRRRLGDNPTDRAPAPEASGRPRSTALGPRDTFYDQHLRFFLTIALPEATVGQHGPLIEDLILHDHTRSSARLDTTRDGAFRVTEVGPRQLWAEMEQLHRQWQDHDRPHRPRFGLTATPTANGPGSTLQTSRHTWELPGTGGSTGRPT